MYHVTLRFVANHMSVDVKHMAYTHRAFEGVMATLLSNRLADSFQSWLWELCMWHHAITHQLMPSLTNIYCERWTGSFIIVNDFHTFAAWLGIYTPNVIMVTEILQFLMTILAIASVIINATAIYVIASNRNLREDVTGRLMISSAVSNLCSGLTVVGVSAVIACLRIQTVPPSVVLLQACCLNVFGKNSISHQSLIAVVKCVVIVKPFTQHEILSGKRVALAIVIAWIYAIAAGVYPLFVDVEPTFHFDTYVVTSSNTGWVFYINVIPYMILMTPSIIISYGWIFLVILKHKRKISEVNPSPEVQNDSSSKAAQDFLESVRSAKCMFTLFVVYVILFLPLVAVTDPTWIQICLWIELIYCALDSFLFMILYPTVRDSIKSKLSRLFQWGSNIEKFPTSPYVWNEVPTTTETFVRVFLKIPSRTCQRKDSTLSRHFRLTNY